MRTNYVLIDYENVQATSLQLLQPEYFRLRIFLGPNNTKLPTELVRAIHRLHDRADYVQLETPGGNALDFHLAYYLGLLSGADKSAYFHIISRDKGFDPLIKHLKAQGVSVVRSESIENMPCFKAANTEAEPLVLVASQPSKEKASTNIDHTIKLVISDLIARKASKPRTIKTLMSTIHAKVGKTKPLSEIEDIYKKLRQRGYVKESGTKVSYELPRTI